VIVVLVSHVKMVVHVVMSFVGSVAVPILDDGSIGGDKSGEDESSVDELHGWLTWLMRQCMRRTTA
jgi:hypothetical protein